jgi:small subunit ribosomal protein S21
VYNSIINKSFDATIKEFNIAKPDKFVKKPSRNDVSGSLTHVPDGPYGFDTAFRKFRKKIDESGLLREIQERMHYEKPTTVRKQKKSAAKKRWQRELSKTKIPKKLY